MTVNNIHSEMNVNFYTALAKDRTVLNDRCGKKILIFVFKSAKANFLPFQ